MLAIVVIMIFPYVDVYLRFVVQKVMGQIVTNISEDTTTENTDGHVPVPVEHKVRQMPKWCREYNKQCWRHHKTKFVHRKKVMNSMKQEMHCNAYTVIWHFSIWKNNC